MVSPILPDPDVLVPGEVRIAGNLITIALRTTRLLGVCPLCGRAANRVHGWYTGNAHERGIGRGEGFTLNIPMPPGSGDQEYRRVFDQQILPAPDAFKPACVLVSAGFDAAAAERIADIQLDPTSYAWMTQELVAMAELHGSGRLISVLEGGYEPASLRRCVVEHARSLMEG